MIENHIERLFPQILFPTPYLFKLTVQLIFLPEEWAHAFKYAKKRYDDHIWN